MWPLTAGRRLQAGPVEVAGWGRRGEARRRGCRWPGGGGVRDKEEEDGGEDKGEREGSEPSILNLMA